MKKGAYKKILFGIFSAFFVLGILIAPTPKTEKVSAAGTCEFVKAIINPSNNGKDSDAVNTNKFYAERPSSGQPVKIQVEVKNCNDYSVSAVLIEDSIVNTDVNYVDNIAKQKQELSIPNIGPYANVTTDGNNTIDFNFLAGEKGCKSVVTGSDCHYFFKVYIKKGAQTKYILSNGDSVYDSMDDELHGNLYYDFDSSDNNSTKSTPPTDWWVYMGSTIAQNAPIQTSWFFKLSGGKWFNSNKFTQKECEVERDLSAGAEKATPCTQTPPADELADGALSNQADATPTCTAILNPLDPDCLLALIKAVVFTPVAWLAGIAGQFFDALFSFSISSQIYGGGGEPIGFLKVAWTFIRDLANLGFIISLLWLAVKQIIDPTVNEAKKEIPKIIIIALMINFSYFFGTIIIDTTNVLARFLYTNDAICINKDGQCDGTISEAIVASFNPQTIIERSSVELQKATGETEMSTSSYAIILLLSIWACWLMAKMFFKLATLFLGRIIQLWAHLVLSPFAFIAYILPVKIPTGKMKGLSSPKDWASEFFRNAFIAPLFMFFMYLIFLVLSKFDFVKTQFATHGHSSFIAIITLIFPIFVVTMLMKSATDATESQAGSIANAVTGYINKAVGAVAGTALALGGLTAGGLIVKGGSKLLGSVSKRMIAKEGTGSSAIGRAFNSKVAKMGGYVNDYAKKLPDKKMDIRENKFLSGGVKNITGFDMTSGKDGINNALRRGAGLRPDETFNQKIDRKAKAEEADVERRKISEKTNKMDNELQDMYNKRLVDMESKAFDHVLEKAGAENFKKYETLRRASGATDEEIRKDFISSNQNKQVYDGFVKEYQVKTSGSEDLFKASNRKAYEDAAKAYNKKVDADFVNKKKRDIYGGKTQAETEQNFKDNKKSGPGGQANPGDLAAAGGKTWGTALAGGIAGAAAATGAGVAGGALFASEAAYQRDGDLEFLRRRENKNDISAKKKADKVKAEAEKQELSNNRLEMAVTELGERLKDLSVTLKENTESFKGLDGTEKNFKQFFETEFNKVKDKKDDSGKDWSVEKKDSEALKEAYVNFTKELSESLRDIVGKISTTTDTQQKAILEAEKTRIEEVKESLRVSKESYIKSSDDYDKKLSALDRGKKKIEDLNNSMKEKAEEKKDEKK